MRRLFLILFVLFPALCAPTLCIAENSFSIDIDDSLLDSLRNSNRLLRFSKPQITLPTLDGDKVVELDTMDIRSSNYKSFRSSRRVKEVDDTKVYLFKGQEKDSKPGDFYRLTLIDDGSGELYVNGYYSVENKLYSLKKEEGEQSYRVSNLTAEDVEGMIAACGSPHEHASESFDASALFRASEATVSSAGLRTIEIATDADYEYFVAEGSTSAANAQILSVLNGVDAIYQSQLNLTISVVFQNVWTTPSDPYTTSNSSALLSQFANYWSSNFANSVNFDLAHLFTGRDLDGGTVGVAYVSAVCSSFRYGLSQRLNLSQFDIVLTAHEVGHNVGASHDSCSGGDSYVMCPSLIPNANIFSPNSISSIANVTNNFATCLAQDGGASPTPVPTAAPTPAPTPPPVVNSAPRLSNIGSRTVQEGQDLVISLRASDSDGDNLSYAASANSFGTLVGQSYRFNAPTGTAPVGSSRVFNVTFSVSDGRGGSDSETVVITVLGGQAVNQRPTIVTPSNRTINEGELLVFTVQGSDPEGPVTYSAFRDLPIGANLDATSGRFSWRPNFEQAGTYEIVLVATDLTDFSAVTSFTIEVLNQNSSNPTRTINGDSNGDGLAEVSVFRGFNGTILSSDILGNQSSRQVGIIGDIPLEADVDGDGRSDSVLFRDGIFFAVGSLNSEVVQTDFGVEDAIPVVGDFEGLDRDNLAIFRPALSTLTYRASNGRDVNVSIGAQGDIPVNSCDMDGDGDDEIILSNFRGNWTVFNNNRLETFDFGTVGDIPLTGYLNADNCEPLVYRPSSGVWYARSGSAIQFGAASDMPMLRDMDGDGIDNLVLHRPAQDDSTFFVLNSDRNSVSTISLGQSNDLSLSAISFSNALRNTTNSGLQARSNAGQSVYVHNRSNRRLVNFSSAGVRVSALNTLEGFYSFYEDYDGDGQEDHVNYYRGSWFIFPSTGGQRVISFGNESTDVPFVGDIDGDAIADIGVARKNANSTTFYIFSSAGRGLLTYNVGARASHIVSADYTGDGVTDPAVVDERLVWHRVDGRTGAPLGLVQWGLAGDMPQVADYDGDARADIAVFRESDGNWFLNLSGGNQKVVQWGLAGDVPVPANIVSVDTADLTVLRPSTGEVFIRTMNGQNFAMSSSSAVNGQLINTNPLEMIR